MITAYNENGSKIGLFSGSFVLDNSGNRVYWIEDGEVFSFITIGDEFGTSRQGWSLIGTFENQVAQDEKGIIIFTAN